MDNKERQQLGDPVDGTDEKLTRRELIRVGTVSLLGMALPPLLAQEAEAAGNRRAKAAAKKGNKKSKRAHEMSVIVLWMRGGPSHLDTFDPKPGADAMLRGPFGAMATNVSGLFVSEHLPLLSQQIDKMAILRGVSHGEKDHAQAEHYVQSSYRYLFQTAGIDLPGAPASSGGKGKGRPVSAPGSFSQTCLQASSLVDGGARLVTVTMDGWDTHSDNFGVLGNRLLPDLDRGFSALLSDLSQRGILASTLVVWMGEFGRTPQINKSPIPGRDEWPYAMSVVMAGGGIRGGQAVGRTDTMGMGPAKRAIRVEDIAATLCYAVGIDPSQEVIPPSDLPVAYASQGNILNELF